MTATIWLDQCISGMRVAETLINRYKAVIVNEGSVLDDHLINKLLNLGYHKLRVYVTNDEDIESNTTRAFIKEYTQNLNEMKSVLFDISSGKSLDMPTISKVTDFIYSRRENFLGVLACLNQLRDADEYTYTHCLNVGFINMLIAKWMNLDEESLKDVMQAGLLHDVGKCRISESILNKPIALTNDEFNEIKKHPAFGYEILESVTDVKPTTAITALEHHEKASGKGYPQGLKSEDIHLFGRITAVADIYDAMTSNRVYHKRSSPFQVFGILEDMMFGSLDPQIVLTFLQNYAGYYVGDRVRLSDGTEGLVIFINPRSMSKPVVQTDGGVVNLAEPQYSEVFISDII